MPRELNSLKNFLFDPTLSKRQQSYAAVKEKNSQQLSSNTASLTGSFRFDSPGSALKSTQQLNIDFSKFENHTFFGSAQAKVQKALGKIINVYPFDGTKSEIDEFLDGLSGFERYVFDAMPRSLGYLCFSGSKGHSQTDGSYISVKDFQGTFSPTLSRQNSGRSVLDFKTGPFTTEFFINIPSGTINENSIILQKINGKDGLTIALSSSYVSNSPLGEAPLIAILSSGTMFLTASMTIPKGTFQHCSFVYDKSGPAGQLKLYRNSILNATSSYGSAGQIDFIVSPLTIGSGTNASAGNYQFVVSSTLSGAIDELRFWHAAKTRKEIYTNQFKNVFSQKDLVLNYRFNEPSGSFAGNGDNLVLDFSGNGLHSRVSNFNISQRNTSSYGVSPLAFEDQKYSPVLFPSFIENVNFSDSLIASASDYDFNNPNLVTKLMPRHYFLEAELAEGFSNENGDVGNSLQTNSDQPGGAKIGQAQIISSILYTMSETFDELKCFIDEFRRLLKVDYMSRDTISDHLLPWLSQYYGIKLSNQFSSSDISQVNEGQNITIDGSVTTPLQKIQNSLWRRILSDLPKSVKTRGTLESLKSTLRNFGVNSQGPIRIRELGGSNTYFLGDSYIRRHEIAAMLDFSGSFAGMSSVNSQGFSASSPYITSSFLSGTRNEPGVPYIKNSSSDGLFTSGSWTYEGTYRFLKSIVHPSPQSLVRMMMTGSSSPSSAGTVLVNLVANSEDLNNSITGSLQLYGRVAGTSNAPTFMLQLTGVNVFDGDKWQVSFGRDRGDLIDSTYLTSSYFLRASKFTVGGLEQFLVTSSYVDELGGANLSENMLQNIDSARNASGSFLVIGNQTLTSANLCLNYSAVPALAKTTQFTGKVSGIRFWSKGLTEKESKMHARNFKSLGVEDPQSNFNFVNNVSGSFQKIRLDASIDQSVTNSNSSGKIDLFDFSQNGLTFSGFSMGVNQQVIKPERFDYEILSPDFKSENPNKIRVRSYIDKSLAERNNAQLAPLHKIPQNEQPKDDRRIQVEVSAVQALNEDIMNIFATLDALDNAIGSPELVFSQDYPSLRNLRRIYFNRLTDKLNFIQVFQFFKWFDETIGDHLQQMLPYDSKFIGTSFVVEPHALERPKFTYGYYDLYLGEENRGGKDLLLLQQFSAEVRKC